MQNVRVRDNYTKLTIRDLSSKYGVYVNKKRLEPATDIVIAIDADHLWTSQEKRHMAGRGYGGFVDVSIGEKTSFRLERVDWSLSSQGLTAQAKVSIIGTAAEIDCKVEESWVPGVSTHLIVGKPKRSEKLFLALAEGGHLVDVGWLKAAEASFKASWGSKGQTEAQSLELDYPAPTPAALINSNIHWSPNVLRRVLLNDYRFIAITATKYSNLGQIIQCAGGSWTTVDVATAPQAISDCLAATVIPVFLRPHGEQDVAKFYPKLDTILTRQVAEAVLLPCRPGTHRFCNPKYLDPLPSVDIMASFQSSQSSLFAPSQSAWSLGDNFSVVAHSTLSRSGSNVDDSKESPQVIGDDCEPDVTSFSLSQLLPLSRKLNREDARTIVTAPEAPTPGTVELTKVDKPAKKKTKTDRMALFFDGLEGEEDVVDLDSTNTKIDTSPLQDIVSGTLDTPISLSIAKGSYGLKEPALTSPPEVHGLTTVQEGGTVEVSLSELADVNNKARKSTPKLATASQASISMASDYGHTQIVENKTRKTLDAPSELSASFSHASGSKKKKSSAFDGVREDMAALKLDIKLGRQMGNLEEEQRLRRLEAQRQEGSKGDKSKIMQSEWSEQLVTKSKRRKLAERQTLGDLEDLNASPRLSSEDQSGSVQILETPDQKNWPERWKKLPNFKSRAGVNSVLQEKWKDLPNYKAFRKSTMAGTHVAPRGPASLALDGEIVQEHEETIVKIGRYVKREPKEQSTPAPLPRRKLTEREMARDDLKLLLAGD
ncbi:hypothetical protein BGZ58_008323 [Dissophora ornata]|nr:hypothetical protein BGZ58_008323 [Dissophora ornata]